MKYQVHIVNIPTAEQANKNYQEFANDVRKNNRQCTAILLITIIFGIFVTATINHYLSETLAVTFTIITMIICGIVCYAATEAYESDCFMLSPAEYQYYDIVNNHNILKTEIEKSDGIGYNLCFTLENNKCEVVHRWIYGFTKIIKTDVKELCVDLVEKKIYEPYYE